MQGLLCSYCIVIPQDKININIPNFLSSVQQSDFSILEHQQELNWTPD